MSYRTQGRCIICNKQGADLHHLFSRGAGGSDDATNLMPLCRAHHSEIHSMGRTTFVKKYVAAYMFMVRNGWKLCSLTNKWYIN